MLSMAGLVGLCLSEDIFSHEETNETYFESQSEKICHRISEQNRHKPGCAVTESDKAT